MYIVNKRQNQDLNPGLSDSAACSLSTVSRCLSDNHIIMSKERSSYERFLVFKHKREYKNSNDSQLSNIETRRNEFILIKKICIFLALLSGRKLEHSTKMS